MTSTKEKEYHDALVSIAQVLGTGACKANKCDGCQLEMGQAAYEARKAIGWLRKRPKKHRTSKSRRT